MYSIAEIRNMLEREPITINPDSIIREGSVEDASGVCHEYCILFGWDPIIAAKCDRLWGRYHNEVADYVYHMKDEPNIRSILSKVQLGDKHWDWLDKHTKRSSPPFFWYYLMVDMTPQAVCLIKQPSPSKIHPNSVFYIDYIAVAPWNRINPLGDQKFKGLGSILMKAIQQDVVTRFSLGFGFNLLALNQAKSFYEKIGMTSIPKHDVSQLFFFEMDPKLSQEFAKELL